MKKTFLILAMVGCLIFSLSAVAMASNVYVGGLVGGKWDNDMANKDDDLSGYILGGEYNFDKFKIGLEYLSATEEKSPMSNSGSSDADYYSYEVKFGYRVLQNDQFTLDAALSYYDQKYDNNSDVEISGVVIGADASYKFTDKISLAGSIGFSVDGTAEVKGLSDMDTDILIGKIQGNYNFTDNIAGFVGYRYVSADIDSPGDKLTNSGATVGVSYTF
jgi:hypothetical protein